MDLPSCSGFGAGPKLQRAAEEKTRRPALLDHPTGFRADCRKLRGEA
jgi:hypothetical protein